MWPLRVAALLTPLQQRRRVLFACRENACRSQMAAGFAQFHAGDKLEVLYGGSSPAEAVNPQMVAAMAEKGIDMYFRRTRAVDEALAEGPPGGGCDHGAARKTARLPPGAERVAWQLPDPAGAADRDHAPRCETKSSAGWASLSPGWPDLPGEFRPR